MKNKSLLTFLALPVFALASCGTGTIYGSTIEYSGNFNDFDDAYNETIKTTPRQFLEQQFENINWDQSTDPTIKHSTVDETISSIQTWGETLNKKDFGDGKIVLGKKGEKATITFQNQTAQYDVTDNSEVIFDFKEGDTICFTLTVYSSSNGSIRKGVIEYTSMFGLVKYMASKFTLPYKTPITVGEAEMSKIEFVIYANFTN